MTTNHSERTALPIRHTPGRLEAGCDEAGRGCIAGPVVAAAAILPEDYTHPLLIDSKQLTEWQRSLMEQEIKSIAVDYAIAFVTAREIDTLNILQASFLAMERAVQALQSPPEHLLIDGNRFRSHLPIPHTCIVQGDALNGSIAAASILAKTARDRYMEERSADYPLYDWRQNKGYPTPTHLRALRLHGLSPEHRRTFAPCRPSLFDLI